MPIEMGLWRIDQERPRRLPPAVLPSEATLEGFLEQDPSLLGERLLVIGRQVRTPYGTFIDLLAIDEDGNLHVLELKRDRTPREVVAQVLDYGSWVSTLTRDAVIEIAGAHLEEPFEAAFAGVFGDPPPDELNADVRLTVVATELDPSSERIVGYLRGMGVPINAVFFAYLEDDGRSYLARSWLISGEKTSSAPSGTLRGRRASWNGRDWFVAFGEESGTRSWDDARRLGFVSAGGGAWYSRTLRALPVGARINAHLPGRGYVGIGVTVGEAQRVDEADVVVGDERVRLADQDLAAAYRHTDEPRDPDEEAEWMVPVEWLDTVSRDQAYWEKGMFANQNSACKLRQEYTLERLAEHFDASEDGDG